MSAIPLPPVQYLRERFDYDPETGVLTWRKQPLANFASVRAGKIWNSRFAGVAAGYVNPDGYLRIKFDGRNFRAHRLAYAIATGVDPGAMEIDHIDGDRLNNRISNLRLATNAENTRHRIGQNAMNTSGFRGVCRHPRGWLAQVGHNGKVLNLGTYPTREEAAEVAKAARARLFGDFAGVGEAA